MSYAICGGCESCFVVPGAPCPLEECPVCGNALHFASPAEKAEALLSLQCRCRPIGLRSGEDTTLLRDGPAVA
jgi:hypothetical protein